MNFANASAIALVSALALSSCGDNEPAKPFIKIQGAAIDGSEDVQVELAAVVTIASESEVDQPAAELASEEAPEPNPEPEGPLDITFWELSLEEMDADAMLDVFLFPEEWSEEEQEELSFPPDIVDLVGREIALEGYVIPGEIVKGNLRDFMLVRDLQACCFGGAPRADEWIDVVMDEDSSAEYHRYLPVVVTGTFGLGGQQDSTGKALGMFKMAGTSLAAEN